MVVLAFRWINGETGFRSDVPHSMIYPLEETRPNLHIVTGVLVKHVTIDKYVFHLQFPPSTLCHNLTKPRHQSKLRHGSCLCTQPAVPSRRSDRYAYSARDKAHCRICRGSWHSRHTGALRNRRKGGPGKCWGEAARRLTWSWRELPRCAERYLLVAGARC